MQTNGYYSAYYKQSALHDDIIQLQVSILCTHLSVYFCDHAPSALRLCRILKPSARRLLKTIASYCHDTIDDAVLGSLLLLFMGWGVTHLIADFFSLCARNLYGNKPMGRPRPREPAARR